MNQRSRAAWILAAICILAIVAGAVLRFRGLPNQILHNDEAWTSIWISGHSVTEMRQDLCGRIATVADFGKYLHPGPGSGLRDTIAVLADDDPKHGPIYFLLLRIWIGIFGDSTATMRALSGLLGLLGLPFAYWLGAEMFASRRAGLVTAALLAVSPVHVLYSQDIRPYSLFVAAIFASSWLLLRAVRIGTRTAWNWYAVSMALSLYIHPLFLIPLGSHAVHAVLARRWWDFVRVAFYVGLAFLPWAFAFFTSSRPDLGLGWLITRPSLRRLAESWVTLPSRWFLDLTEWHWNGLLPFTVVLSIYIALTVALVVSFLWLWRSGPRQTRALPIALFAVPMLVFIGGDFVLGSAISTVDRYLLSAMVGAQLGVSYAIASLPRAAGTVLLAALLLAGLYTSNRSLESEAPWIKPSTSDYRAVAAEIHRSQRPLLVSDCATIVRLSSFTTRLDPGIAVFVRRTSDPIALDGYSDAFLLRTPYSPAVGDRLKLLPMPASTQFWRIDIP